MKRSLVVALVAASMAAASAPALAGVNCNQVKKYLDTGRTPQDVADTMVISVDDVKKCQAGSSDTKSDAKAPAGAPAAAPSSGSASSGESAPKK